METVGSLRIHVGRVVDVVVVVVVVDVVDVVVVVGQGEVCQPFEQQ
jgi:hypothetical protein